MSVTRLSGGLVPADGSDPRTFPSIWNATADVIDQVEGDVADLQQGFRYAGTRYFTSSGTFDKADPLGTGDIGLRAVRVTVVGAGGAARALTQPAAGRSSVSGGGGGGGFAIKFYDDMSALDASESVAVGAGVVASGGGASTFKSLTGPGGSVGQVLNNSDAVGVRVGGTPGVGTGGDINGAGNGGGTGVIVSPGTANAVAGGQGGASLFGGAPRGTQGAVSVDSITGLAPGAGASGGGIRSVDAADAGAAGADGIVIIDCFV